MRSQRSRQLWLLLMTCALLANAGCLTGGVLNPSETSSLEPGTPSKIELPPAKSALLHLSLAQSLEKNGRDAEAADAYEKARSCDPQTPNVARHLAAIYDRLGNNKRALEEYHLALKATPRDANLINRYGYFYYTRGQWKEAEAQFRQAIALNPNSERAWINLGLTLGEQQRYEESVAAFAKAVSRAEALSNLAFVLTTQGKKDEAKKTYQEALRVDPNLRIAQLALQKLEAPTAVAQSPVPERPVAAAPSAPPLDQSPIVVEGPRQRGGN